MNKQGKYFSHKLDFKNKKAPFAKKSIQSKAIDPRQDQLQLGGNLPISPYIPGDDTENSQDNYAATKTAKLGLSKSDSLLQAVLAKSRIHRQQRQLIKKNYQSSWRRNKAASQAKETGSKAGRRLARFVAAHHKGILLALGLLLALLMVFGLFSSCTQLALAGLGALNLSSGFPANDLELTRVDLEMSRLETLLKQKISQLESVYPGYDQYLYKLSTIGHDPLTLAAYLATKTNLYTLDNLQGVLEQLMHTLYQLSFSEKTELVKIKDADGQTQLKNQKILTVRLSRKNWADFIQENMTTEEIRQYESLQNILATKEYFACPFLPGQAQRLSSHYGWRIHPIYKDMRLHRGLDIGVPLNTPILAIHSGQVALVRHGDTGFGNYLVIEDAAGYRSTYAHCQTILVQAGQLIEKGSTIALAGSTGTSTGSHLHLEIRYQGEYLNPFFFISKAFTSP